MNDILELNAEREIAFERKPQSRQRSTPARLVTSAVIKYCTGACSSALFSKVQQPIPPAAYSYFSVEFRTWSLRVENE